MYNEFWSWPCWMVHLEPSVLNNLNQWNINNQKRLKFPNQTSSLDTCTRLFFSFSNGIFIVPLLLSHLIHTKNIKYEIQYLAHEFSRLCARNLMKIIACGNYLMVFDPLAMMKTLHLTIPVKCEWKKCIIRMILNTRVNGNSSLKKIYGISTKCVQAVSSWVMQNCA